MRRLRTEYRINHNGDEQAYEYFDHDGRTLWRVSGPRNVLRWVNTTITEAMLNNLNIPPSWEDTPMQFLPQLWGAKQGHFPMNDCKHCDLDDPTEEDGMVFYTCKVCGSSYLDMVMDTDHKFEVQLIRDGRHIITEVYCRDIDRVEETLRKNDWGSFTIKSIRPVEGEQRRFKPIEQDKPYKVSYTTADGDLCHVVVKAKNTDLASTAAKAAYWDIQRIVKVTEAEEAVNSE